MRLRLVERPNDPSLFPKEHAQQPAAENRPREEPPVSFDYMGSQQCNRTNCIRFQQDCHQKMSELQRDLRECEAKATALEVERASLRLQLFHSHKDARKHDEVEKLHNDIVADVDLNVYDVPDLLAVRHSYAESLVEQGKFQEAEGISREVWQKRKKSMQRDDSRRSHHQLCSILFALEKHHEARDLHRKIWEQRPRTDFGLDNGDDLSKILEAQGEYDEAILVQSRVWKARMSEHSHRDPRTIKSGLRKIELHEKVASRSRSFDRQCHKGHIKEDLKHVWNVRLQPGPESNADILDVGCRLGDMYLSEGDFKAAERVFKDVWSGRKQSSGIHDKSTMSIGTKLGLSLKGQANAEKYTEATGVFEQVWTAKKAVLKRSDDETISSATNLASVYYLLGDWTRAESVYQWIYNQKQKKQADRAPEAVAACFELGRTIFKQGKGRHRDAVPLLREVHKEWKTGSPQLEEMSDCSLMLAESMLTEIRAYGDGQLSPEESDSRVAKCREALDAVKDVHPRERVKPEKAIAYWSSSRLYGLLLLESKEPSDAQNVLKASWEIETKTPEEKAMALECGRLYCQTVIESHQTPPTKEALESIKGVLEKILLEQQQNHPNNVTEIGLLETHLQQTRERLAANKPPRTRSIKKGIWSLGAPRKRR